MRKNKGLLLYGVILKVDILSDPNISRADFERTLMMEERSQLAREARRFAAMERNVEPSRESGDEARDVVRDEVPKDVDNTEVPLFSFAFLIQINIHQIFT